MTTSLGPRLNLDANSNRSAYDTSLAVLENGDVVVAWHAQYLGSGGLVDDIVYRRVGADGQTLSPLGHLVSQGDGRATDPTVVATPGGGFVVGFIDDDVSTPAHPTPTTAYVTAQFAAGAQSPLFYSFNPGVTDVNGSLAVDGDGVIYSVTTRKITLDDGGYMLKLATAKQSDIAISGHEPRASAFGNDIVIVYTGTTGGFVDVFAATYDGAFGQPMRVNERDASERLFTNPAETAQGLQSVATLQNGDVVIVWTSSDANDEARDPGSGVRGRILSESGVWVTPEFRLAALVDGDERNAAVCALEDGGFAIAFENDEGLNVRAFDPDGGPRGGEFLIAAATTGNFSIAEADDGALLVNFVDNSGAIFLQRVDLRPSRMGTANADTLDGRFIGDVMRGLDGDDRLFGYEGDDVLDGGGGNDRLDGGEGADSMRGGTGDDIYIVDDARDQVAESLDGGTDRIDAWVNVTLGDNVENVVLKGATALRAAGNGGQNLMIGNAASNRLDGGANADDMRGGRGDDTYIVDNVRDRTVEELGGGSDRVEASVTFTLSTNIERLILKGTAAISGTGNALDNIIVGNDASNRIDGKAGRDDMRGGNGDDSYTIDNVGDSIVEAADGGADRVEATVDVTLAANVERLILQGTAALSGTGNAAANVIVGNDGANRIDGKAGGDDLRGGAGRDSFVFTSSLAAGELDRIRDFVSTQDRLLLDDAVFEGLARGALGASSFTFGSAATTAAHRFVYDKASGALFFDEDGAGGQAQVQFAVLGANTALANTDIVII